MKPLQILKRGTAIFLALLMIAGLFPASLFALAEEPGDVITNIAYQKTFVTEGFTCTDDISKLTDGDMSAMWDSTNTAKGHYISLDLEGLYEVSKITIYPYTRQSSRTYYYEVFLSADGETYTSVAKRDATNGGKETSAGNSYVFETPYVARYMKIQLNGNTTQSISHFHEIEVFGKSFVADKTELNSLISAVEEIDTDIYTEASVNALTAALAAAKLISTQTDVTQEAVDSATANLKAAKDALSYRNIAYQKTFVTEGFTCTDDISKLTDGDMSAMWDSTRDAKGNYISLDLEGLYEVSKITIYPYTRQSSRTYYYEVFLSADGETYTSVAKRDATNGGKETTAGNSYVFETPYVARYMKIQLNGNTTQSISHFHEIEVFGKPFVADKTELNSLILAAEEMDTGIYTEETAAAFATALTAAKAVAQNSDALPEEVLSAVANLKAAKEALAYPNIALGKPATAEGIDTTNSRSNPMKLTDGDKSDYWDGSSGNNGKDIIIDLEKVYEISKITIYPYCSGSRSYYYDIFISPDGQNYKKVASKTERAPESKSGTAYPFAEELTARYIKVLMYGNTDNLVSHIYEIEAFGKEFKTDMADLKARISAVEEMDLKAYTERGVAALNEALVKAKAVAEMSDATADQIYTAAFDLSSAKSMLMEQSIYAALNEIKEEAPTLSADGTKIVFPKVKEGYKVSLYGSSNESVIALDGTVHTPLCDMTVGVMYRIEDENNPGVYAFDNYTEATVVIPGKYTKEAGDNAKPQVLPAIREWKGHEGNFTLTENSKIVYSEASLEDTALQIAYYFKEMLGKTVATSLGTPSSGDIYLTLSDKSELGEEGYFVEIADVVRVEAFAEKGVLYAGVTLTQILSQDEMGQTLPCGLIRDYPEHEVRSIMLDVSRTYMPLSYLKEVTRYMAYYKCNEVHVHINEDNGEQRFAFRLESKLYPEINSSLDPDKIYSQEDYRAYQKDAKKFGIKVITEIDTPGHSGFVGLYNKDYTLGDIDDDLDIRNEDAVNFIKSLFDEFLDGPDPVIQGDEIHVGCDEYLRYNDTYFKPYRNDAVQYYKEIIDHVEAKGLKCRMWNMLGESVYPGIGIIDTDVVQQYFSEGQANYRQTIEAGYPIINSHHLQLYVVALVSENYGNYRSLADQYNNWDATVLGKNITLPAASPLFLGAEPCYWGDRNLGYSEFDVFQLMKSKIMLVAEKTWYGAKTEGQTADEYMERVEMLGTHAPGANPERYVKANGSLVAKYDFENVEGTAIQDGSGNDYDAILNGVGVVNEEGNNVLSLNKEGYLTLPFGAIGYPYTVSFDLFLEEVPENAVLFYGQDGVMYLNYEGTGKIAYVRKGFTYSFNYQIELNKWNKISFTCDGDLRNMDTYLQVNDKKLYLGKYVSSVYQNGLTAEISSSFVLPTEQIGAGFVGKMDNFCLYDEFIIAEAEEETIQRYTDPRKEATKIYYALAGGLTASDVGVKEEDVLATADDLVSLFNQESIFGKSFEPGSVLVVKTKGNLMFAASSSDAAKNMSKRLAFGAQTLFRSDYTKLPIVIEGTQANSGSSLECSAAYVEFANDYFFTNLTIVNHGTTQANFQAGSGMVTFDKVILPSGDDAAKVSFRADAYSGDAFATWVANRAEKVAANDKDGDGFLDTGFTFGRGTSYTGSGASIYVAANASTPAGNKPYGGAGISYVGPLTAAKVQAFYDLMKRGSETDVVVFGNADNLPYADRVNTVRPFEIDPQIIIDNGNTNHDAAEFCDIIVFGDYKAVGSAEVKIYSGNVNNIYTVPRVAASSSSAVKNYFGDVNISIMGGKVHGEVLGLYDGHIVGDYTLNIGGDAILAKIVQGSQYSKCTGSIAGDYVLNVTGDPTFEAGYAGAPAVISADYSITHNIYGGTFENYFSALCYTTLAKSVTNNIYGGSFNDKFYGGVGMGNNKCSNASLDIINNIYGTPGTDKLSVPYFGGAFYADHKTSGGKAHVIRTVVSDAHFSGVVHKANAGTTYTSASFEINSTDPGDIIKFGDTVDYNLTDGFVIDSFSMNGGRIEFYQSKLLVNNVQEGSSVVLRNISSWSNTDAYSIRFNDAKGKLEITTDQASTANDNYGAVAEDGDTLYVCARPAVTKITPAGATLILKDKIGVKIFFDKREVESVDDFNVEILLDGKPILSTDLTLDGDFYYVITEGLGLKEFDDEFTLGGDAEGTYSIASLAEIAASQWKGNWKTWAESLVNLNKVYNRDEVGVKGADLDKEYNDRTAEKGEKVEDLAGAPTIMLLMSNVVGVRFTVNFNTLPTELKVYCNTLDLTDRVEFNGNTATFDIFFSALYLEEDFGVTVKDGEENYFTFSGSAASLAKELALGGNVDAEAVLWYIQATVAAAASENA